MQLILKESVKMSTIIPLHKGSSKQNLGNYRPISILSPLNKIFELLLHKRLLNSGTSLICFQNIDLDFVNISPLVLQLHKYLKVY